MKYRELGRTGLSVSALGFGASPLGAEFGAVDVAEARRAVHRALDHGITYFDVAPYYGRTLAEERLGEFLEGRREEVVLATKTGRYGREAPDGFDFSAERVRSSLQESLRRLRTDYVDIFQVHDVEYGDASQIIHETLPALLKLKEEGRVRAVGITGYPLRNLKRIAEAVDVDCILSYCRYNLVNRDMDDVLTPFADEREIGLINASPLLMRALTEEGPPEWHPAPPAVRRAAGEAARLCREAGTDLPAVALRFAVSHPTVATTLVGMHAVEEVESNVAAAARPIPNGLLTALEAVLEPVLDVRWEVGRPENRDR